MEINLQISLNSDVGCVRTNNEDMILVAGETYRDECDEYPLSIQQNGRLVIAIADGMGGHNAGELASEMALKQFDNFILKLPEDLSDSDFRYFIDLEIKNIHNNLNRYGEVHQNCFGLGTTLTALLTYDNHIYTLNCGDSRIYRLRNGMLCQLTVDHSEQNRLNDSTVDSNVIYNCLGGGGVTSFADVCDITNRVFQNDIYLLCSDGLSDMLTEDEIEKCLSSSLNVCELISLARAKGGIDNISAITVLINDLK